MILSQAAGPVDPAQARAVAEAILAERRFHPSRVPQPFRGLLRRAGDAVASAVNRWIGDLPGPPAVAWIVLGGLLVLLVVVIALRLIRRRSSATTARSQRRAITDAESPASLERRADLAEQAGDLETAVRLRFRAGLLRLDAAGVIDYRPSLTTAEVARSVRHGSFDGLAASFEEIVYGRRRPVADDVRLSREGWRDVLDRAAA